MRNLSFSGQPILVSRWRNLYYKEAITGGYKTPAEFPSACMAVLGFTIRDAFKPNNVIQAPGLMLWFMWKKFSGSYLALILRNRS